MSTDLAPRLKGRYKAEIAPALKAKFGYRNVMQIPTLTKVVGIGGGGVNAINRMIDVGLKGVEFIAINTDAQHLLMSDADVKLDIGRASTKGLGAGAAPEKGRQAAIDHRDLLDDLCN